MTATPSQPVKPNIERVSPLELFFDVVFVFAVTQFTGLVSHPHSPADYLRAALVFTTLMWIYDGFAWLTSNIVVQSRVGRQLIFVAMTGFFMMALGIPNVFGAGGLPYALGFLLVTTVHALLFTTARSGSAQAIWNIAPFNFASALLVLLAAFVRPPWDWSLWLLAVGAIVGAVFLQRGQGFELSPSHFVERHGLLIIVALGESIVAVGVGASGLPVNTRLITGAVLTIFLSASLWWTYFDKDQELAEHRMTEATPAERARMALFGFGLAHFVMIFGVVLVAAGLEVGIAHPADHPEATGIWNLATGLALYLLGDAFYRRVLRLGSVWLHLLIAGLMLVAVPLGLTFGALVHLAVCGLLLLPHWLRSRRTPRTADSL